MIAPTGVRLALSHINYSVMQSIAMYGVKRNYSSISFGLCRIRKSTRIQIAAKPKMRYAQRHTASVSVSVAPTISVSGMGVLPSKQMRERLAKMNSDMDKRADMIEDIQDGLREGEDMSGAFYCSYPSFTESYRYMKRVIERSGQSAYLMLCTITDGKGYPLEQSDRLEMLAEELGTAIQGSLRRGDLYTKYSANQFLVLLLDIKQEDCLTVIDRVNKRFDNPSRKNYLKYHVAPVNEVEDDEGRINFDTSKSIWN